MILFSHYIVIFRNIDNKDKTASMWVLQRFFIKVLGSVCPNVIVPWAATASLKQSLGQAAGRGRMINLTHRFSTLTFSL